MMTRFCLTGGLNHECEGDDSMWNPTKAQINGTTAHITAIFGMTLSGLVVDDIYKNVLKNAAQNNNQS